jgi:transposase
MEVIHPRCAGLDVHKDTVVAAIRLASNAEPQTEVRTFSTTTPGLLALSDWLSGHGCTHIAMEATGVYWKPVWHILADGTFTLILTNPAHVKNVPGRKTDVADALWLADLLAHGLIRASFVPEPATQAMRGLLRTRKQLVREQASHIQRVQKVLEEANPRVKPEGMHQARRNSDRRYGTKWPCGSQGADRGRDRSESTDQIDRPSRQGLA